MEALAAEIREERPDMPFGGPENVAHIVWTSNWLADHDAATRASAADTVLAEARRLCCGENPSPHHAASARHSERMAFAGDLARAVRGLSHG